MISIREVAKEANVSVATVSRVLNKTGAVADKTRTAVLDAVEKLGYKPNFFGKSLRSSKTNIILVMLSSLANTFCADVIRAIDKTASELGYYIIVCTTNGQKEKEEYYINFACNRLSDGMIILNSSLTESEMSALSEKICLVQCNEYSDMHNTPFVSIDNKKAAYDAVSLLASNGRKRIVFYTVDNEFISTTDRLCGYKQALADNGLEFDRRLVLYGNYGYHNAERGFSEFLENDIPFDAVLRFRTEWRQAQCMCCAKTVTKSRRTLRLSALITRIFPTRQIRSLQRLPSPTASLASAPLSSLCAL